MSGVTVPVRRLRHSVKPGLAEAAVRDKTPLTADCGLTWIPIAYGRAATAMYPNCRECFPGRIHEPHYVYRCYDAADILIYVGCTLAPRTRMDSHRVQSWWYPQVTRVRYIIFPNRDYGLEMERKAIAEENPRWNIRGRDRGLWGVDDYRNYHAALVNSDASASRVDRIRSEAARRYGLDLPAVTA